MADPASVKVMAKANLKLLRFSKSRIINKLLH